jgi:uncharacterized protein (DUF1800 family)
MPTVPRKIARKLLILSLTVATADAGAASFDIDKRMDEPAARAMLNRFGYGADLPSLATAMQETPRQYLMHAIQDKSGLPASVTAQIKTLPISQPVDDVWDQYGPGGSERGDTQDPAARKSIQKTEREFVGSAIQARLLTLANADNQGHEALLSFWLNHFSIYGPKSFDKVLAGDYARALEAAMADDSFESLLKASFYHPAMQVYLDNAESTSPTSTMAEQARNRGKTLGINENLARELMELHTLGVDAGYTQKDVQELARIITGAGVYAPRMRDQALTRAGATRNGLFLFDPRRHDYGAKTFLGETFPAGHGLDEIDRAIHLLATNPATAHHIAFKLARRFLSDTPPNSLVDAMAGSYLRSGGKISATLMPLIASREFAESLAKPSKFKEPVDYMISAARAACSGTPIGNRFLLAASAQDMGAAPFMHTTPDGYGVAESDWLSPAAMAKRTRLAMAIAAGKAPLASGPVDDAPEPALPRGGDMKPAWARGTACEPDADTVARLAGPLSASTLAAETGLSDRERIALILASPEFMRR